MAWEPWAVLLVLASALGSLYLELAPPDQVMFAALVVVWHLGLVTTQQAFAGFSNSSLLTIGSLFIVARAVDRSKVVDRITRGLLGQKTTERGAVFRLCLAGMALSGFLNNTPLVALLMPIVRDWARTRRFAASKFLLPLSYSTIMGGLLTVIGSSTNLVVNGLLEQMGHEPFGFFEPALVSLPVGLVAFVYLVVVVPPLLPGDRGGLFRALREDTDRMVAELELTGGFPLLGTCIFDALDELGIEGDSLVKVMRLAPRAAWTRTRSEDTWAALPSPHAGRVRSASDFAGTPPSRPPHTRTRADTADGEGTADVRASLRRTGSWGDDGPEQEEDEVARVAVFPVPEHEVATEGDVLVLSLAQEELTELVARRPIGLQVRHMHPSQLMGEDEFVEVVLAPESPIVGKPLSQGNEAFRRHYGAALIAMRPRRQPGGGAETMRAGSLTVRNMPTRPLQTPLSVDSSSPTAQSPQQDNSDRLSFGALSETSFFAKRNSAKTTSEVVSSRALHRQTSGLDEGGRAAAGGDRRFAAGDIALVLVPREAKLTRADFLLVTRIAGMPPPVSKKDLLPLVAFCIGLALTVLAGVSMLRVAVTLSVFCLLGGWVQPREVRDTVDWHLLILIGSALGLAQAVQTSGLSQLAAAAVQSAGLPPRGALGLLFLLVMCVTELVTNNAAAALGLPLAVDLAKELGMASPRPFAMAVMLAASTSYACPIGYATNLMVLGPGGYTFGDFLRVGILMDCIYWVGCTVVLPLVWPLE
uniref:Citrate transporter-like domain-containing protein n=1 Tax=Alexandrium monilatum TaxID=311494 RepID=A0A7S4UG35_9DINO